MSPLSFVVLSLFVIIGVILFLLGYQQLAAVSGTVAIVVLLLEKAPKSKISIRMERVNSSTHKIIVENAGNHKIKDIRYVYHGRLLMPENYLPTELSPQQTVELPIGLSFETGNELDVEVSWKGEFAITRQNKRIKTQAIG